MRKLMIRGFHDPDMGEGSSVGDFSAQINPETLKEAFSNSFEKRRGIDSAHAQHLFATQNPRGLSFTLVLDATGVVPGVKDVPKALETLQKTVYRYNGEAHSPNYLRVLWGKYIFPCQLQSMSIKHDLFSPAGRSLRAQITLDLKEHLTAEQITRRAGKRSDDLSKSRQVIDGKSLPMMCQDVYGDPTLLVQLARANDLDSLTALTPGQILNFPPVSG